MATSLRSWYRFPSEILNCGFSSLSVQRVCLSTAATMRRVFGVIAMDLPLSKKTVWKYLAWHHSLKLGALSGRTFLLDALQVFVFNIDLPDSSIEDTCADSRIYWGHYVPGTGGLAVTEGRVFQAILELTTVMRVKSNGTTKFSLAGADKYRAMYPRSIPKGKDIFKGLEDVLEQLSTPEKLQ